MISLVVKTERLLNQINLYTAGTRQKERDQLITYAFPWLPPRRFAVRSAVLCLASAFTVRRTFLNLELIFLANLAGVV